MANEVIWLCFGMVVTGVSFLAAWKIPEKTSLNFRATFTSFCVTFQTSPTFSSGFQDMRGKTNRKHCRYLGCELQTCLLIRLVGDAEHNEAHQGHHTDLQGKRGKMCQCSKILPKTPNPFNFEAQALCSVSRSLTPGAVCKSTRLSRGMQMPPMCRCTCEKS